MHNLLLAIASFLVLGLIYSFLERKFALHPQKINRFQWQLDAVYYFSGYWINKFGIWICIGFSLWIKQQLNFSLFTAEIANQPLFIQLIEVLLLSELGYYLAHRLFHTVPFLWRFHAIHHSAQTIDWLTTTRVHPCDQLSTKFFQLVPLLCLDFSSLVMTIYFLWSSAIAFFIHANLRIKLPILRRLIVTPEIHHWHHHTSQDCHDVNFAAQLACIDWLFGTYYCPQKKHHNHYGIDTPMPNTYLKQFFYPFRRTKS